MVSQTPDKVDGAPEDEQGRHERPDAAGAFPSLRLVLQASGYVVELTRPDMVLGRHSECDVRLPLPDVSRHHCRFTYKDGAWFVSDLHSMNGVFVNGARVAEAVLKERDTVAIGGFKFEVQFGGLVSETAANATAAHEPLNEHNIVSMLKPALNPEPERRKAS
jgi:pSer/pThr/pTyr-binding forkhead associated (FHA) protein